MEVCHLVEFGLIYSRLQSVRNSKYVITFFGADPINGNSTFMTKFNRGFFLLQKKTVIHDI